MAQVLIDTNFTSLGKTGPYETYLAMFGVGNAPALVLGKDYTTGVRGDNAKVNEDVLIGWQLPLANNGVRGYINTTFGNGDGGTPATPITPRRLSQITTLKANIKHQVVGDPISLLLECWPSSTAHATGTITDKTAEVGCYPDVAQYTIDYMNTMTQLGTFNDPYGRNWTAAVDTAITPNFMTFRPTNGLDVQGEIDFKAFFMYLVGIGRLPGDPYFNGLLLGPEPVAGKSTVKQSLTATYA